MGAVTGLLGVGGGANGTGFAAPSGTNPADLAAAQRQTQNAINQQQAFANALNPGGTQALGSQQNLLSQFEQGAQGKGPNPALAQLNQTTAANTANQAALMASQRGASVNPALIARQAAMQGAANQQNAAGQAATLAAQQQLQQQQALQAQQQQMVNQQQAGIGQLGNLSNTHQGNLLGMQAAQNNANASLAGGMQSGQQGLIGGLLNSGIGGVSQLFGGGGGTATGIDAVPSGFITGAGGDLVSDPGTAIGTGTGLGQTAMSSFAKGGRIPRMADGGFTPNATAPAEAAGPQSLMGKELAAQDMAVQMPGKSGAKGGGGMGAGLGGITNLAGSVVKNHYIGEALKGVGDFFSGFGQTAGALGQGLGEAAGAAGAGAGAAVGGEAGAGIGAGIGEGIGTAAVAAAKGGKVPAMVSPGEQYLSPRDVEKVKKGASPMQVGEKIPGKPKVGGAKNSYANDTVPKTLEEGGLVLPRSVTQSAHPHWEAMKFVRAHMAKGGLVPKLKGKK